MLVWGTGAAGRADSLYIYWPSGALLQRLADLPIDAYVSVAEGD